jgi:uncharacterized RDD family membrane protein YckC
LAAPDKLTIDTPEQIALEYTLAGAGSRFLALAVDTGIQALAVILTALVLLGARAAFGLSFGVWVQAAVVLFWFLVYYGYFAVFETVWSGQTPGKRIVGLRVIGSTGRPITAFDAILRNLLRIVDSLPGIYAVGIISVFVTARSQRLGDLAADTVVVHEQSLRHQLTPPAAAAAASRGAARLDAGEIEAMETFVKRREELPIYMRDRTARQLAQHLRERLDLSLDPQLSDEALIEELVVEYRRTGRSR